MTGKTISSNSSWGGNPAKRIKNGIFWEGSCVHKWSKADTAKHENYYDDRYIYDPYAKCSENWDLIDLALSDADNAERKLEYIQAFIEKDDKNRFAI